jgi:hypothetical protein
MKLALKRRYSKNEWERVFTRIINFVLNVERAIISFNPALQVLGVT